ncbi:MAG: UDP-N-acetylmuramoylalanyl-D-glutamyl-2,6-diaminopimelate--D-alanyl-D-alanine ligase [Rhodospirillales bacterium]|jgi:UDP-N-acetylmuramoyl-tripeptide--D-alanyl-D-alanine ligase|nr:UDP-N-acetylmuramoylalanyl-D-glutamyl-2,6-diaminopimelate--D-alanyl-D-alanine ligase [Rhodospirillales bacterium]
MIDRTLEKAVLWTAIEAAKATGGQTRGEWSARGVSIDSRTVEPGDLFIAIAGPSFDGHDFVSDALARGAVAAIVSHPIGDGVSDDKLLLVDDCFAALWNLGGAARGRTSATVIAVTGSVGKTGTKDALKKTLGRHSSVHASKGNLNNHWGLPLSLARLPRDADYAVLEMGMNHSGEISPLTRLARPHVAMITTVQPVHSEFFASVEEIADAKAEIFEGVEKGGVAVLNRDNPFFDHLASAARKSGIERIVSFGAHETTDVRLLGVQQQSDGSLVRAVVGSETIRFNIGIPGRHWVENGLAVLATVWAAGGDVVAVAASLADLQAPKGRGQCHSVPIGDGAFDLIDESYNASPISMGAAFENLGLATPQGDGRRIAVLGDMLELGTLSPDMHAALAEPLQRNRIAKVFTAGTDMARLWDALPNDMRAGHAADAETLAPMVTAAVRPGDVVMVKGSAGSRTAKVVEALLALGSDDGDTSSKIVVNGS